MRCGETYDTESVLVGVYRAMKQGNSNNGVIRDCKAALDTAHTRRELSQGMAFRKARRKAAYLSGHRVRGSQKEVQFFVFRQAKKSPGKKLFEGDYFGS